MRLYSRRVAKLLHQRLSPCLTLFLYKMFLFLLRPLACGLAFLLPPAGQSLSIVTFVVLWSTLPLNWISVSILGLAQGVATWFQIYRLRPSIVEAKRQVEMLMGKTPVYFTCFDQFSVSHVLPYLHPLVPSLDATMIGTGGMLVTPLELLRHTRQHFYEACMYSFTLQTTPILPVRKLEESICDYLTQMTPIWRQTEPQELRTLVAWLLCLSGIYRIETNGQASLMAILPQLDVALLRLLAVVVAWPASETSSIQKLWANQLEAALAVACEANALSLWRSFCGQSLGFDESVVNQIQRQFYKAGIGREELPTALEPKRLLVQANLVAKKLPEKAFALPPVDKYSNQILGFHRAVC